MATPVAAKEIVKAIDTIEKMNHSQIKDLFLTAEGPWSAEKQYEFMVARSSAEFVAGFVGRIVLREGTLELRAKYEKAVEGGDDDAALALVVEEIRRQRGIRQVYDAGMTSQGHAHSTETPKTTLNTADDVKEYTTSIEDKDVNSGSSQGQAEDDGSDFEGSWVVI